MGIRDNIGYLFDVDDGWNILKMVIQDKEDKKWVEEKRHRDDVGYFRIILGICLMRMMVGIS